MFKYRKKYKMDGNWWQALKRDEFTCQLCQRKVFPSQWSARGKNRMVVHHLDGTGETQSKNHSLENLIVYCEPCHKLFHTKINLVYQNGEYLIKGEIFKLLNLKSIEVIWD
jgi:predicted HNH restriction endonuclease